jgi:hypothetical protein
MICTINFGKGDGITGVIPGGEPAKENKSRPSLRAGGLLKQKKASNCVWAFSCFKIPGCAAGFIFFCGENGIRTHEPLLAITHFPGVRLRPLGHLS